MSAAKEIVLVTGASGYIAAHVIKLLQEEGYRVRGTVRSIKDENRIKHLYNLCPNAKYKLELVEADLLQPDSWTEAIRDCTFIHHVASPLPAENPKHEDEVIKPAVDGTLNVLKAAAASGTVKRVILTSAMFTVATKGGNQTPYSEKDWSDPVEQAGHIYAKSKTLAERAAWDFMKTLPEKQKFELATIIPGFVVGPTLSGNPGSSTEIITRLLTHQMPMCPKLNFPVSDVRDIALAHSRAMTVPEAAGNRHIIVARGIWLTEMAAILCREFRSQGYNVPTKQLPDGIFAFTTLFNKMLKSIRAFSGKPMLLDTSRMTNVLGITPIDVNKTFVDMGYSLIEYGIVKKTSKYRGPPRS